MVCYVVGSVCFFYILVEVTSGVAIRASLPGPYTIGNKVTFACQADDAAADLRFEKSSFEVASTDDVALSQSETLVRENCCDRLTENV